MASASLTPDDALAAARRGEGFPGAAHHVYLGRLTNTAQADFLGAAARKSPEFHRLAYVVQFTGLDVPPVSFKPGTNPSSVSANHEFDVFVDARSGREIEGTSFR